MTTVSTLGSALAIRRHELGLDLTSSALAMGVSRSTYTAYESDSRRLSFDTLPVLAKFLDVPVEEILYLYGGTCILQASRALFGDDDTPIARAEGYIERARANGDDRMDVVRRVYFGSSSPTIRHEDEPTKESMSPSAGDASAPSRQLSAALSSPVTRAQGAERPREANVFQVSRDSDPPRSAKSKKSKGAKKSKKSKKSVGSARDFEEFAPKSAKSKDSGKKGAKKRSKKDRKKNKKKSKKK